MNATHRISKARTTLLLDHPFFGALLYRLKPVPNNRQPTMATDGVSLFYNDNFVEDLAPAELVGVLAHEVMHPALKHHVRRGDRNPRVWNIACDYAINPLLVDAGLHLPKGILLDNSYRGMSAEAIYNRIAQEQEESGGDPKDGSAGQGKDGGQGQEPGQTPGQRPVETPGGFGQVMDAPNPEEPGQSATPAQISQQEQQWSEATTQAAAISRMAQALLDEWLRGHPGSAVRLLGVGAGELQCIPGPGLFAGGALRDARLDAAVDDIRRRFGGDLLTRASLLDADPPGPGAPRNRA